MFKKANTHYAYLHQINQYNLSKKWALVVVGNKRATALLDRLT
jgi:hypothetical protein